MANGNGLKGNPSSTQSAIIIPKPQDSDTYYIFTVDTEYQNTPDEGFHYSEVDMTANGGLGAVTNQKNINLLNNTSEKLSAVLKDCQTENIWVITFADQNGGETNNTFYAYEVSATGVNTTPVVSTLNISVNERRGYLKISPDGTKIACANVGSGLYLFDFDTATGQVSNPQFIQINANPQNKTQRPYGVEFSPNSQLLYVSAYFETQNNLNDPNNQLSTLLQYDLTATNISASENVLDQRAIYRSALQLGPDGKIYRSLSSTYNQGIPFLSTINSPNNLGQAADYQHQSINLNGQLSRQGLPPFIASFFTEKIDIIPTDSSNTVDLPLCNGEDYTLIAEDIPGATYTWTQDGLPIPTPTIANELLVNQNGNYQVLIDLNNGDCDTKEGQAIVTYFDIPTATTPDNINICDDNNDGIWDFDLSTQDTQILDGQDPTIFQVNYFTSQIDADNNQNTITNGIYQNSNPQEIIYARVDNIGNSNCYETTSFQIAVYQTPSIGNLNNFEICDNLTDGDDTNGQTTIDLSNFNSDIYNGQSQTLFNISYYNNLTDAEDGSNPLPLNYYNNTPFTETIFVRLENVNNTDCYATGSFDVIINPVPITFDQTLLQCDEDGIPDGYTIFNLEQAISDITNNNTDLNLTFYDDFNEASNGINPIPNPTSYNNLSNPQTIFVASENASGCVAISELILEVSTTQINNYSYEDCDELGSEDGFNTIDLNQISADMLVGLPTDISLNFYETYEDALTESNALPASYNNTIAYQQTIYARAENNNACYGISEVNITINLRPDLEADTTEYYCLNFYPQTITLSATMPLNNTYYYDWSTGETTNSININQPGTFTVTATTVQGCEKTRTFIVEASNIATIEDALIVDGSIANNQVTIVTSGEGIYEYEIINALGESSDYQSSNVFTNVSPGIYSVNVKDIKNDCGITSNSISVIGFPQFFTPNNDTVNDYWQVYGVSDQFQPNSLIYIFDRYGKLLSQIDPKSKGWDGTFNGNPLPQSDYWFAVTLQDGRLFRGHFTLKR